MLPVLMLLGFATWTLMLLIATVGVYRWSRIFRGQARISQFRADGAQEQDWYQRATRAHANCIENLPVFGALVFALYVTGVSSPVVDPLCAIVLAARIVQSLVHVCFVQTDRVVSVRFSFFTVQAISFLVLIGVIFFSLYVGRS
jgi:uncharacterized MAPEG superfamily protein